MGARNKESLKTIGGNRGGVSKIIIYHMYYSLILGLLENRGDFSTLLLRKSPK